MIKKYLHRVFIDGLSGMAMGLFATLIVGTIIQQIGTLIGGQIGDLIFLWERLRRRPPAPVSVWVSLTSFRKALW